LDEDIDLPDFTHELVEQLTDSYDADVDLIRTMPGVNFIMP